VIIALVLSPLFAVSTAPYQGLQLGDYQNPLPVLVVGPAVASTLRVTAAFAIIFGALGGLRAGACEGFWQCLARPLVFPAWLRGAFIAFLTTQIALSVLAFIAGVGAVQLRRLTLESHAVYQPALLAAAVGAPEAAGIASYFFQGAELTAGSRSTVGRVSQSERLSANMFLGAHDVTETRLGARHKESRRLPTPGYAFVGLVFAAVVFVFAGQLAARTAAFVENRWLLGLEIALADTGLMLAAIPIYGASLALTTRVAGTTTSTLVYFRPAPWSVAVFSFGVALVFSLIGTLTAPRRAGFRG